VPVAELQEMRNSAFERFSETRNISLAAEVDESTTGPASLMLLDPDGNPILLDQHVPAPTR